MTLSSNKQKKPSETEYHLPEKKFKLQDSILTQLFEENKHGKTVYNLYIVVLIYFSIKSIIKTYVNGESIELFSRIVERFDKLDVVAWMWIGYIILTFCSYYCFIIWARTRILLKPKHIKLWDVFWIFIWIGYNLVVLYSNPRLFSAFKLPMASTLIILLETMRLLMKNYAFVRSNVPKVLALKTHDKLNSLPGFSKFLYFIFAPTLVYRDEYPRTNKIRWSFVMCKIAELALCILYCSVICEDLHLPKFKHFCSIKSRRKEMILLSLDGSVSTVLFVLPFFFALHHVSQNLFAELLRFGDRKFYGDWWNGFTAKEWFRKWNYLVGDWIYTYIYKDMYEVIAPGKRKLALVVAFTLSSLAHEWITFCLAGYLVPIVFIHYMFGGFLAVFVMFPKQRISQIFGLGLLFGILGNIGSLHTMEYYARSTQDDTSIFNFHLKSLTDNCTF